MSLLLKIIVAAAVAVVVYFGGWAFMRGRYDPKSGDPYDHYFENQLHASKVVPIIPAISVGLCTFLVLLLTEKPKH